MSFSNGIQLYIIIIIAIIIIIIRYQPGKHNRLAQLWEHIWNDFQSNCNGRQAGIARIGIPWRRRRRQFIDDGYATTKRDAFLAPGKLFF